LQEFIGMRDRGHARIVRHLDIEPRVADHKRAFRFDMRIAKDFPQHARIRLGSRFIGTTAGVKPPFHAQFRKMPVNPLRVLPVATVNRS
jgi:hypothetical protein